MKRLDPVLLQLAPQVLLSFGDSRLLIPQSEVRSIESADSIVREVLPEQGVGWVELHDQLWPVYCLADNFQAIADAPLSRKLCVMLGLPHGLFGLQCDDARMVDNFDEPFRPLPACMRLDGSPVRGLAAYGGSVFCCSSAFVLNQQLGAEALFGGVQPGQTRQGGQ